MEASRAGRSLASVLAAAEAASPVNAVEAVTRELGRALGATKVSFLVADLSGRALVRLAHVELRSSDGEDIVAPAGPGERRDEQESATVLPFDGGPAELAVRTQEVQVLRSGAQHGATDGATWTVLAPVTERGEVVGLLELALPAPPDDASVSEIAELAHLLAFVVIANRRHTELFEWGQRTRPLSLSAEIQARLLPGPQTCEAGSFTLAAWLEPAADIAGDTFDFSVARDQLHLSLTDAMGHGVGASLTATLCVGSLRNARHTGATLVEQVTRTNASMVEHANEADLEDFVTGLIGRVDLRTGELDLVNAGHVAPYLARGPNVTALELPANLPLGLFSDAAYAVSRLVLEPGDRLIFITDGMLERSAVDLDLSRAIADTRLLHPREAVRALADQVLAVTGNALADDAAVLCLDWHGQHDVEGQHEPERDSLHGADQGRASPPVA